MTTPPESSNPEREENAFADAPVENGDSPPEESISRFAGPVSLATLISRVAGFFRDLLIAKFFGAAMMADAFFVAFAIPNLFRRMFMEGALSSSFLPVYSDVREQSGPKEAKKFAGGMLVFLIFAGSAGCAIGIWFADPLMRVLAPGFASNPEKLDLAAQLTRIMFPFIIFIGLWAVAAGMLNAARRFFVPALAPALQNVVIISALLLAGFWASRAEAIRWLAWAVVIGGAAQFFFQLPFMGKLRILPLLSIPWRVEGVGRCLALMGPAALGGAIFQINVLVDRWLASFLAEGSISYLYYANRLVQLPHGILSLAVVSAVLPVLSDYGARNRENSASRDSERNAMLEAGRLTLFITIPSSFGLMVLAHPIMEVIFERGAFTQDHTVASAAALRAYAAGLMFFRDREASGGGVSCPIEHEFPGEMRQYRCPRQRGPQRRPDVPSRVCRSRSRHVVFKRLERGAVAEGRRAGVERFSEKGVGPFPEQASGAWNLDGGPRIFRSSSTRSPAIVGCAALVGPQTGDGDDRGIPGRLLLYFHGEKNRCFLV